VSLPPQVQTLTVDPESEGQRLDNFLVRHLKGVPKTHVYRIIRSGEVRVNKGRAQADTRVQAGQLVRVPPIRLPERIANASNTPKAPPKTFEVLYENERWLAINKPEGVAVHGGSGVSFGVIEQLRAARPEAKFLELVHRLDRETSGILLIAKRRSALVALQDQFRNRSIQKAYLALVHGEWPKQKKVIDIPLHKYLTAEGERRVRFAKPDDCDDGEPEGKRAISLVNVEWVISASELGAAWAKVLGAEAKLSLLQVTIKTGRTHQIRVHTSGSGYPIVGDEKYGKFTENKALAKAGFPRMYLHAWRLSVAAFEGSEAVELLCEPSWRLARTKLS
jgi:23S rRNA pseudouridine955/2504/2580 synthase